ncbi:MAG: hypothetical protein A2W22_01695 [Candidatus Levybacteria bacterium RBG_16_35_11]|nr:MAG: hypothetical protein A2W22_01695 [Candidatus Levybacteria bacterium RBG_16_35_11]
MVLSEKRRNLLLLLLDSPKTLSEIREALLVTSSGIIPQIRKMEDYKLIYQKERKHVLTEMGKVLAEYLQNFQKIQLIFGKDIKFWNEHNISVIPHDFRLKLHELGNYEIIKSTPTDLFRPNNEYMKNLLKARWIKGVSSVLQENFLENIGVIADKNVCNSIIFKKEILENLKETQKENLKKYLNYKNTSIMVCDEKIEIDFTVTDFFLSIRLFLEDGTYDFHQNILSFDESAIIWGKELFSYYEERSRNVRI